MRKGVLVAVGIATLLNMIVVLMLFQATHGPVGYATSPEKSAPAPLLGRHGENRPFETQPSPSRPLPPTSLLAVLGMAAVAAGASVLALGALTVVALSRRRTAAPQVTQSAFQSNPVLQTDHQSSLSRFDPAWRGTLPSPHREVTPTPKLVIPESLGMAEGAMTLQSSAGKPSPTVKDDTWLALVRECVDLYEEMDGAAGDPVPSDHIRSRLLELLERVGVDVIENDSVFQRTRHQAKNTARMIADGTPIRQTISPGFAVGNLILKRAAVQIVD